MLYMIITHSNSPVTSLTYDMYINFSFAYIAIHTYVRVYLNCYAVQDMYTTASSLQMQILYVHCVHLYIKLATMVSILLHG